MRVILVILLAGMVGTLVLPGLAQSDRASIVGTVKDTTGAVIPNAKVKSILEEQQKQMAALRQDSTLSPEDRRAKFQEIHQKTSQEIREALNKDQQRKFDELENKRKGRMKEHHGPPSQSDQL